MTNFKKKRLVGYLVVSIMCLLVVGGVIIFAITHLDSGVIAKYNKQDSEELIENFIDALQKGDESALDYVWYHKDSSKMLKEIEDYKSEEASQAVTDEMDAYKGMKVLLNDNSGSNTFKIIFKDMKVSKSKSKTQKIYKSTLINDKTKISYKDYGHTALYYMYEETLNNESVTFNSIDEFNELFETIDSKIPISEASDCCYLVHTSKGLKINAYLFLKALGVNDIIYTGKDSTGNVCYASLGQINIGSNYTSVSDYEAEKATELALEQILEFVQNQDLSGLYAYVSETLGDSDETLTGELGNLLYNYTQLDDTQIEQFESILSNYEEPKILLFRNSANLLTCACLLKMSNSYTEAVFSVDSTSISDNTIALFNCTNKIYAQFNGAFYEMGITNKDGTLAGATGKTKEIIIDENNEDHSSATVDESKEDESKEEKSLENSDSKEDSDNMSTSEDSDNTSTSSNSYYSEEEIETMQKNDYASENELEYREGDGSFGGEDHDSAFTEDKADSLSDE